MSDSAGKAAPETKRSGCPCWVGVFFGVATLLFLFGIALGPPTPGGIKRAPESAALQQAFQIGHMMFSYSNDHDQQYPDGASSTEVFQKLIDGQYCADPAVFYIPRTGKIKALAGQKLKPENVCFDVTGGIDSNSGDDLPVVFTTGYRVNYVPGGDAVPIKGVPKFSDDSRSWFQSLNDDQKPWGDPGIAVYYKRNSAVFLKVGSYKMPLSNGGNAMLLDDKAAAQVIIPRFISPDYKPDGKTYRQLTPEGVLP